LPDGFFSNQKKLGHILEGLRWENVDIGILGLLEYFMEIWDVLLPIGTFCVHLVHFFRFWYDVPRKIWQPCRKRAADFRTTAKHIGNASFSEDSNPARVSGKILGFRTLYTCF
jgi:hypothetical protein